MADERTPRTHETRAKDVRPSDSWIPPTVLPEPNPQDGWVFRWIRTSTYGHSDATNVSNRFREGWQPVKAEDHPELQVMSDVNSRFKGCVEIGGLLLCKAPEETMKKRTQYYEQMSANQMKAVDQTYLRESDPRMPMLNPERSTRTEFGRG